MVALQLAYGPPDKMTGVRRAGIGGQTESGQATSQAQTSWNFRESSVSFRPVRADSAVCAYSGEVDHPFRAKVITAQS